MWNDMLKMKEKVSVYHLKLKAEKAKNKELKLEIKKVNTQVKEREKEFAAIIASKEESELKLATITALKEEFENKSKLLEAELASVSRKAKEVEMAFTTQSVGANQNLCESQRVLVNRPDWKIEDFIMVRPGLGYTADDYADLENPKNLKQASDKLPMIYEAEYMGKGYESYFLKTSDAAYDEEETKRAMSQSQIPFSYADLTESYASKKVQVDHEYFSTYTPENILTDYNNPKKNKYIPSIFLEKVIDNLQIDIKVLTQRFEFQKRSAEFLQVNNDKLTAQVEQLQHHCSSFDSVSPSNLSKTNSVNFPVTDGVSNCATPVKKRTFVDHSLRYVPRKPCTSRHNSTSEDNSRARPIEDNSSKVVYTQHTVVTNKGKTKENTNSKSESVNFQRKWIPANKTEKGKAETDKKYVVPQRRTQFIRKELSSRTDSFNRSTTVPHMSTGKPRRRMTLNFYNLHERHWYDTNVLNINDYAFSFPGIRTFLSDEFETSNKPIPVSAEKSKCSVTTDFVDPLIEVVKSNEHDVSATNFCAFFEGFYDC